MKNIPTGAKQHITAGPYSPVLEVTDFNRIVVISGQAPLDLEGNVVGTTIEEHTAVTLENCKTQLEYAGCTFEDVFKVNVYLTDLNEWERFNKVYQQVMPKPLPARTAVGVSLLNGFKVEIEMWASSK